jgi:hypothetical protein
MYSHNLFLLSSEAREMSRLGGIISDQATTSKWLTPIYCDIIGHKY